ncbi:MAG: 2,3-bisphosphoglycerate-independent phosphoglycerate mutase [Defluviitaleaceae bacterium]|nr:2,3-bisphosphoglycerate-independent phosphoglycerate mutase [Defluviitaleaceae bacterium]
MRPVVLIVMDGIGISEGEVGNAVLHAYTPNLDYLLDSCPSIRVRAHGKAVGLPDDGDMGNSEVGHNALGSGQVYAQGAKLVGQSIETGAMFESQTWLGLTQNVKNGGTLHFIGLLSDGNVHSNTWHLVSMIRRAKADRVRSVRVHALLDGRDVAAQSALKYIDELEELFLELNDENFDAKFASGGGRQVITMDRYGANWAQVERGWNVHVHGKGDEAWWSARAAVVAAHAASPTIIDQDLPPFVIVEDGEPVGKIVDGDSVLLFNFRGDRAIQISQAFETTGHFEHFERGHVPKVYYAGMLQYDGDLKLPEKFLVPPPKIVNTLTEELVKHGIKQFACSETQKFGHMTYFWNGNRTEKICENLEDWTEIPSDIVPFEQRPWMKAAQITDAVVDAINSGKYGFIRANFPNGDMVGHTGSFHAAQIGVSAVDLCLGRVMSAASRAGATLLVTSDHGNAEEMLASDGSPKTAHSLNFVPFIAYTNELEINFKDGEFGLANVAATIAHLLGLSPHHNWEVSMI